MFEFATAQVRNRTILQSKRLLATFAFLLFCVYARAATWYVDSSVSSSGNGQSWATAWKQISNVTGLAPGDTVYISGGPSGSSQTYTFSGSWSPASGTTGNRITYKIGQDSAHNGTAFFSGSGVWLSSSSLHDCTISGDAGDGKMHFSLADPSTGISPWTSIASLLGSGTFLYNFRLSYVNAGQIDGGTDDIQIGYSGATCYGIEMDHLYMYQTGLALDVSIWVYANGYVASDYQSGIFLHDVEIHVPHQPASPVYGTDCFDHGNDGVTVSNCSFYAYPLANSGQTLQHQDGVQTSGGSYQKYCNNYFYGMGDIGFYMSSWGPPGLDHILVYNNVIVACGVDGIEFECENPGSYVWNNCYAFNNVVDAGTPGYSSLSFIAKGSATATWVNCLAANNIVMLDNYSLASGVGSIDNVFLSTSQATASFTKYTEYSTNSNYHLTAAAPSLIGQGTNLSSYFNYDKDGNARASSGAWDIGAYAYGAASTNPILAVSPSNLIFGSVAVGSSNNLSFTVQNTGGGTLAGTAAVASPFSIVSGGTYSLGANQSQVVTVRYSPTVTGTNNANVTFTGGGGATATVSGSAKTLSAINVSPANPTVFTGSSQQFSAVGTFSDGSTQDVSSLVAWSSTTTSVATINSSGLATGASAGTTTISATLTGKSGSTVLTVQAQPLTVNTTSVPGGLVNAAYSAPLVASGGSGSYSWSITSGALPLGLALNSSGAITGTPRSAGTSTVTVQVRDSAAHTAGQALSIVVSASATIWPGNAIPTVADAGATNGNPVELGVKFTSDTAGTITGIRFYKASANTGTHVGNLWATNGTLLASATFANETASGWQQVLFTTPVTISSNTVYVASYHTTSGHFSEDDNYFASSGVDNPPLHALVDGASGGDGAYAYSSTSTFPNQTWMSANYWVDVMFQPSGASGGLPAPTGIRIVSVH